MEKTKKTSSGFTLIEVLVVISIIGILSAVVYANFTDARNEAKNRAWQTELKEIQLAIELYKAQNGMYPATENIGFNGCDSDSEARSSNCLINPVVKGLVPDFISELPKANTPCDLVYRVDATDRSWYKLIAENCLVGTDSGSGTQPEDEFALCPETCSGGCDGNPMPAFTSSATFYESLAVYSAGGQCQ
jgi:type II secretion system protein G